MLSEIIEQKNAIDMKDIFKNDPRACARDINARLKKHPDAVFERNEWMMAFQLYSYILSNQEPSNAPGLFAHLYNVQSLMLDDKDWATYDLLVRQLIARKEAKWGDKFSSYAMDARSRNDSNKKKLFGSNQNQKDDNLVPRGFCVLCQTS